MSREMLWGDVNGDGYADLIVGRALTTINPKAVRWVLQLR